MSLQGSFIKSHELEANMKDYFFTTQTYRNNWSFEKIQWTILFSFLKNAFGLFYIMVYWWNCYNSLIKKMPIWAKFFVFTLLGSGSEWLEDQAQLLTRSKHEPFSRLSYLSTFIHLNRHMDRAKSTSWTSRLLYR